MRFSSSSRVPAVDPRRWRNSTSWRRARRRLRAGRVGAPPRPRFRRPRSRGPPGRAATCCTASMPPARALAALLRGSGRMWSWCVDCTPVRGRRNRTWRCLRKAACMPSGRGGTVSGSVMDPSAALATAEFLVVDTETNGLGRARCELTEIGAVLVGGGELHDRWDTLVAAPTPLARGIQRFTGITQAMIDQAPRADDVLPELARLMHGRVLVAHSASFDRRVLRQAFERSGLAWPAPPFLCTVALARRFARLVRQRRLGALAGSLGLEVEVQHRPLH